MSTDRVRVAPNERVDIEDFRHVAGESTQGSLRQICHKFFMEESVVQSQDRTGYIMSGFAMSNPSGKQLQVDKGIAILSQRLNGAVVQGVVATEGDASLIVDLNSYAAGDYGIYIRFDELEGNDQGRIFWNPTGSGSEYVQSVPTRHTAAWSLRVESSSPGSEWLKIGEVAQATMTITDQRPFYFEGMPHTTTAYQSGWSSDGDGGANDRNADRATYGIGDLHTFIRAVKQCIEDIKGRGLRRWWERDIGGLNVGFDADPVEKRVAVGDNQFYLDQTTTPKINFATDDYFEYVRGFNVLHLIINGSNNHVWGEETYSVKKINLSSNSGDGMDNHVLPTVDDTYDLGRGGGPEWRNLFIDGTAYIDEISLSDATDEGFASNVVPNTHGTYDFGGSSYRWLNGYFSGRVYSGTLQLAAGLGGNVNSNLSPIGSHYLGSGTDPWAGATISGTATIDTAALDHLEVSAVGGEGVGTDLVPDADATHSLGNSSYYWDEARITGLIVSLDDGGSAGCNTLLPFVDGVYHLGKDARRWGDAFIDCLYESEAAYLWNYLGSQVAISSSSNAYVTPDTEIDNNILSVDGSKRISATKKGHYHGSCTFRIDASAADTISFSIALYKNTGALGAMELVTNSDQLFKETWSASSEWKNFSYNFVADLSGSGDEIAIRITHISGTSDLQIEATSHLVMGKLQSVT